MKSSSEKEFITRLKYRTDEDLIIYIEGLWSDLCDANICHTLNLSLKKSIEEFEPVFRQANIFWSLTMQSLQTKSMISLCRAYDQIDSSVSLPNVIRLISDNIGMLSIDNPRIRKYKEQRLDEFISEQRVPVLSEIQSDLKQTTNANLLVKKLTTWRSNIIAHRSGGAMLKSFAALNEIPISNAEYQQLIDLGFDLLNKYSVALTGGAYSRAIVGQDDFLGLLKVCNEKIDEIQTSWDNKNQSVLYQVSGSSYEI